MNTLFKTLRPTEKLVILRFLIEERFPIHITFVPEGEDYVKEDFPNEYRAYLQHIKHNGEFVAAIDSVKSVEGMVTFKLLEYDGGNEHTPHSYRLFTCPEYPKGIELEIFLHRIASISLGKIRFHPFQK